MRGGGSVVSRRDCSLHTLMTMMVLQPAAAMSASMRAACFPAAAGRIVAAGGATSSRSLEASASGHQPRGTARIGGLLARRETQERVSVHGERRQKRLQPVLSSAASNVASEAAEGEQDAATAKDAVALLTYLESNSWQWEVSGVKLLIDPIIVGALDFGIPWLYSGKKKVLRSITLADVAADVDYLLITQSLDDHCHLNTLRPLAAMRPELKVIATPNAEPLLTGLFSNITYLEPGDEIRVEGSNGEALLVKATAGPVLGPPWQRPENGYIVRSLSSNFSAYIEPHCQTTESLVSEQVDVVVTPVVKQQLPAFTLVSGQEDAVTLAKNLKAKFVVPMANADVDASGVLSLLVQPEGTVSEFEKLLKQELPQAKVLVPTPGVPLPIYQ